MITAGIDVGSVAAKAVILDIGKGKALGRAVLPSGWNAKEAGENALRAALNEAGCEHSAIARLVATGYGRVSLPFADHTVTEISCHARGAAHLFPATGIVLDIGGQDSKVISLEPHALRVAPATRPARRDNGPASSRTGTGEETGNDKTGVEDSLLVRIAPAASRGRRNLVRDFVMNDKCAAGTGRFLQVLAGILGMSLDELGEAAGRGRPVSISSMCAVFAESEIVGLLAQGTQPENVAAGVYLSVVCRVAGLARRIPMHGECTFAGGLATSPAFRSMIEAELGVPVNIPEHPQCMGALGAALIAAEYAGGKDFS